MSGITAQAWHALRRSYLTDAAPDAGDGGSPRGRRGIALAGSFAAVLLAIGGAVISDGTGSLFSLGGLVVVFGGVTASAFMSFRPEDVRAAMGSIAVMLEGAPAGADVDLRRDMEDIVRWARIAYRQGMRGLEHATGHAVARDPFVGYALNLVVSDYAPEDVRAMLDIAAEGNHERDNAKVEVLATMASHAPAFGMVGTLIGMISMLHDMSNETGAVGGMLAVAFLSTLYGVLSARMIYMPAAARVEQQVEARRLRDSMVTEGMVMLAGRKPATVIRDRLNAFLPAPARNAFDAIEDAAEDDAGAIYSRRAAGPAVPRRMLTVIKG